MRTFLAITIPPALHRLIRHEQEKVETVVAAVGQGQAIRWTPPDAVHLTLRFLGETTAQQRQALQPRLTQTALHQRPITLTIGETGCFPNLRAPNIIWLGLQTEGQELFHLQQQVEQAVQAVGFPAERKPFRPHLTIGRMGRRVEQPQLRAIGQRLAQYLANAPASHQPMGKFVVNHFVHIQSQLQPTGSVYTPLQLFNFGKE